MVSLTVKLFLLTTPSLLQWRLVNLSFVTCWQPSQKLVRKMKNGWENVSIELIKLICEKRCYFKKLRSDILSRGNIPFIMYVFVFRLIVLN